jgi:cytochrome P450
LSATCHAEDDTLFKSLRDAAGTGLLRTDQVPALAFIAIAAGRETTANLLASGTWLLLSRPPAWERLHAHPESVCEVVEELLRLVHPLEMATLRYAVTDFKFDGVLIRQGDVVIVGIASANRDPARFDSADDFDPKRPHVSSHLSFGRGPHACIGAGLARLEAEVVLTMLCRMLPDLRLASTVQPAWKPGLISRGLHALNVAWTPPPHSG